MLKSEFVWERILKVLKGIGVKMDNNITPDTLMADIIEMAKLTTKEFRLLMEKEFAIPINKDDPVYLTTGEDWVLYISYCLV